MPFDNPHELQNSPVTRHLIAGSEAVRSGWCKGMLHNEKNEVCAIGALCEDNWNWHKIAQEITLLWCALPDIVTSAHDVAAVLDKSNGHTIARFWVEIAHYNNDANTSKEDILALYERAIMLSMEIPAKNYLHSLEVSAI